MENPRNENELRGTKNPKGQVLSGMFRDRESTENAYNALHERRYTDKEIKDLGKSMQQHHQKSYDELTALAKSKMITIPTQTTDQGNDSFEDLSKETGKDFDKAYADLMVDRHEDAVDLFKTASEDSEDMEIKRWATASLPMLQTHLDRSVKSKEFTKNL